MKNLIVVLMALMSSFAFGQTNLTFLKSSNGSYMEKSVEISVEEINFTGNDSLTSEQNWKVYLAEGEEVLLEKSDTETTYQGFVRQVSTEETIGFLDEEQAVQIKRSKAIQDTGFAWELVVYGLILFSIISFFQKAIVEKTDALVLNWVLGWSLALPLALARISCWILGWSLASASDAAPGARNFFILMSGIFQALFSFYLFPDTEEIFSIWIVSVSFGLSTYYLWRGLEKLEETTV